MSTRKPSKNLRHVIKIRYFRSPLPTAKVFGHDVGPVGDGGHLHLGALQARLPQCHGEQQEEKHCHNI